MWSRTLILAVRVWRQLRQGAHGGGQTGNGPEGPAGSELAAGAIFLVAYPVYKGRRTGFLSVDVLNPTVRVRYCRHFFSKPRLY